MKHACRRAGGSVGLIVGELDWPPYASPGAVVRLTGRDLWGRVDLLYRCCAVIDVACFTDQGAAVPDVLPLTLSDVVSVWGSADYPANVPPTGYRIPGSWPRVGN